MSGTTQLFKRISNYFKWLIQTIAFLSAIVTLLLFLGIGTAFAGYITQEKNFILIGIGIVILTPLVGITYYTILKELTKLRNVSNEEGEAPSQHLSNDVEILRKEIVYEYLPDGQTIYQRKHIKLRALKNSVTRYEDRYRWTGNGTCTLRSKTTGFEITNQHKEEGIWDYFDVTFPRTLHKDDTAEFTIEWELFDEQVQAQTFLSATIDHRETKYLLLQVNLPNELAPTSAYFEEYKNFLDKVPLFVERLRWSPATRSLKYEIYNPVMYHQYFIKWYRG